MVGDKITAVGGVFLALSAWFTPNGGMAFFLLVGGCLIVVGAATKFDSWRA